MNEDYKNIIKLAKMLENKQLLETDDLKGFVTDIVNAFAQFRSASQEVNKDTKDTLNLALKQLNQEHDRIFEELQTTKQEAKSDVSEAIKGALTECKNMCDSIMAMRPKDGEPGKDADEEYIIAELLKRIPQMPEIPDMDAFSEQVDGKIQKVYEHIKKSNNGFPGVRALQNLIDVSVSTPTNGQVLAYNTTSSRWENSTAGGGSGTVTSVATAGLISGGTITTTGTITTSMATGKLVGRSTAGTGIMEEITVGSGLTLSGGTLTATGGGTGDVVGPASATDNAVARFDTTTGKLIQNSGVTIDDTNIVSAAGLNLSGLTASQIVATDASKNLQTLTTATYPSLTELSYVKGVTSAIQTQLNAKGAGTVTNTGGSLTANAIVLGAGTNDTKVVTGITTDGVSVLNLGVNATTIGKVKMFGNTSGDVTIQPTAAAGTATVQTLPATTGTLVNRVTTGNGVSATNTDGALAFTLGAITPSTVNGNTITTGTGTLTLGAGKTLTVSNTLTFTGTDTNSFAFPSGSSTVMTLASTDTITGVKTFSTAPVFNALPTGTAITSAATASTIVTRDSSANIAFNNWTGGYATTATAAGTTVLTVASSYDQFFTGSTTQTVTLPVTSTLTLGHEFRIVNNSTGAVTVQSSGANTVLVLAAGTSAIFDCILTSGTTAASWSYKYFGQIITSGKSLSVSNTLTLAGTDASTLNIGTGGTLGTAAFTNSTAYEVPLTFSTGLTRTVNTITVNTSQNISTLSNLTSNGLVTTSGGTGALSVTVPGTGVLTALAVNVGTAGAFVVNGGALGTPSSGTVTNLTGTASININGTVGATTPTTGSFTTVTASTSTTSPIIIGGTGTTSTLTLQATSGVGTTGSDILFKVGNNGATEAMRIANSGNVGIGTTSTSTARLNVQAGTSATGTSAYFANVDGVYNPYLVVQHSSVGIKLFNSSSFGGASNNLIFGNGSTSETMRIDASGNLLIGTTSQVYSEKLAVQNDQNSSTYEIIRNNNSGSSAASAIALNAYGNSWGIEIGSAAKNSNALTFSVDYLGTPVEKMRLTTDGNLGLGVAPSAWISSANVLDFVYPSVGMSNSGAGFFSFNAYVNSVGNWIYKTTDEANRFVVDIDGSFSWYTAPSGTAGTTITFTQAMTLSASSNLTVATSVTTPQVFNAMATATVTANAATITRANRNNKFVNSSAAAMTITLSTASAAAGDMLLIQIYDFSAVAQTITWVNTENSTVTVPATSNGSTTLPLTVGFMWNASTSKWRVLFYS